MVCLLLPKAFSLVPMSSERGGLLSRPPSIGALFHPPFFGGEGFPTKMDYRKKGTPIPTSRLEDLVLLHSKPVVQPITVRYAGQGCDQQTRLVKPCNGPLPSAPVLRRIVHCASRPTRHHRKVWGVSRSSPFRFRHVQPLAVSSFSMRHAQRFST